MLLLSFRCFAVVPFVWLFLHFKSLDNFYFGRWLSHIRLLSDTHTPICMYFSISHSLAVNGACTCVYVVVVVVFLVVHL